MTPNDVAEAIAETLAAKWPDRLIYRDFCPAEFERPSFFLYIEEEGAEDRSIILVEWAVALRLEIFCATDLYDISSTEELRQVQGEVLALFGGPKMAVLGRHVTISAKGDGQEPGTAFVDFTATWMDIRSGYKAPAEETMENYTLRVTAEERNETI